MHLYGYGCAQAHLLRQRGLGECNRARVRTRCEEVTEEAGAHAARVEGTGIRTGVCARRERRVLLVRRCRGVRNVLARCPEWQVRGQVLHVRSEQ